MKGPKPKAKPFRKAKVGTQWPQSDFGSTSRGEKCWDIFQGS